MTEVHTKESIEMNVNRAVAPFLVSLIAACGGMEADSSSRLASAASANAAQAALRPGAVFTMTDGPSHNAVLSFTRSVDGALVPTGSTETGGAGSGGGEDILGSQGALVLSGNGRFLLAVNAGSNEVSSFSVDGSALTLVGRASSGGSLPVSVAVHDDLVYVVNAGTADVAASISGLRLGADGALTPLSGSTLPLGADHAGPGQIAFDASGEILAVTEKATQAITLYDVGADGLASGPRVFPSAGKTPFGFAFTQRDDLLVSEAQGGQAGGSSASSYRLDDGTLEVTSASVPDGETSACWLVVTRNGHYAFVANAASSALSSYFVDGLGRLTLIAGDAAVIAGGKPLDLALAAGDRYVYVLDAANHAIAGFTIGDGGGLAALPAQASGLPDHAVGLAAR